MQLGIWAKRTMATGVAVGLLIAAGCTSTEAESAESAGALGVSTGGENVPQFRVDPFWPRPLPENWILGQVAGLSIDAQDHIWVVHRQGSIQAVNAGAGQNPPIAMCCVPAPPVVEFDPDGNVVRAWGGPGEGYDWPQSMHGIHVDYQGNIWLGGNGAEDHQILKFTPDGQFILQIGARGASQGSNDLSNVAGPAMMFVDQATDELYVADGYQNRRVVVFDANTGEYKRHWGSFGETNVDDTNPGPYDPAVGASRNFRNPVHFVTLSNDGILYVADRVNNRIQMFTTDGEFIREVIHRPETGGPGSIWAFGLSRDPEQRWLYIPDGTNNVIWIFDRASMTLAHYFGRGGRAPGQFDWVHDLVVDSQGNLITTEVQTGHRLQKFMLVDGTGGI